MGEMLAPLFIYAFKQLLNRTVRAKRAMIYAPMALFECPECGGKVSDKATQCPHCGCPVEQPQNRNKTCPECGQEVDVSVMVCPNCAFPFSRIDEIGKPSNAANTIQNGKLIIEVDNPVIPLLASISIKIDGEKVAECHKGDIIELPIEKDCEVSFKWNMAFTSVSIYAAANEVKRLFIGFDSTNLQIYEEVLGQVGDVAIPNEESVAANIPEPMADEFAGQQTYYPVQSNGSSKWGYIITIALIILPNYFWVKETDLFKSCTNSEYSISSSHTYNYQDALGKRFRLTLSGNGDAHLRLLSPPKNDLDEMAYQNVREGISGTWRTMKFEVGNGIIKDYYDVTVGSEELYVCDGYIYTSYSDMKQRRLSEGFRVE